MPAPAVRDFVLGHLRIQIAVLFGEVNGTFSDAAYKISRRAKAVIFKDDWQRIFEPSDIREQVRDITHAVTAAAQRPGSHRRADDAARRRVVRLRLGD